ncbi:response regulator [Spirosoma koreense]
MKTEFNPTSPRILVVDDNVDASLIVSLSLKLSGYSVQRGDSGPQALSIAQSWQPQAILLDISMPDMDGYETCRILREQSWGQGVVIIALTGYGQAEDRRQAQAAGFDWHLIKPVDLAILPALLTELIGKKQADAALE